MADTKVPIWLDCDPGHDDAFAILLAAHHPKLDLLGISTIHGNASLENTTINTLRILTAIGKPSVPVYPGVSRPFCRTPFHAPDIHGESGLDGTDLLPAVTEVHLSALSTREPAVLAMRNAILAQDQGKAWIVATGAWTNVALCLSAFPDVARHVAGVSLMGGAIGGGFSKALIGKVENGAWKERCGNTTRWAEFNVYCDPEAGASLMRNPLLQGKVVLIPLDITHLALATKDILDRLLIGDNPKDRATPHPMRVMFHDLLSFFAGTYKDVFGICEGPPLHDPLAVAVVLDLLNLEDFGFEGGEKEGEERTYWLADVLTDGEHGDDKKDAASKDAGKGSQLGRTVLIRPVKNGEGGIRVPDRIKRLDKFWDVVEITLQQAQIESTKQGTWN